MTTTSNMARGSRLEELQARPGILEAISNFVVKQPLGAFGAFIVLGIVMMGILAPFLIGK